MLDNDTLGEVRRYTNKNACVKTYGILHTIVDKNLTASVTELARCSTLIKKHSFTSSNVLARNILGVDVVNEGAVACVHK